MVILLFSWDIQIKVNIVFFLFQGPLKKNAPAKTEA
jgi:hypothetical protein